MPQTNPVTGWNRSTWENLADRLIQGAHRHSSPGKARVTFPSQTQRDATSELEGFARSFLLASIRIAGAGAHADLIRWYATALASGTQQNSPEVGHPFEITDSRLLKRQQSRWPCTSPGPGCGTRWTTEQSISSSTG